LRSLFCNLKKKNRLKFVFGTLTTSSDFCLFSIKDSHRNCYLILLSFFFKSPVSNPIVSSAAVVALSTHLGAAKRKKNTGETEWDVPFRWVTSSSPTFVESSPSPITPHPCVCQNSTPCAGWIFFIYLRKQEKYFCVHHHVILFPKKILVQSPCVCVRISSTWIVIII
jgi:hypothetical protein